LSSDEGTIRALLEKGSGREIPISVECDVWPIVGFKGEGYKGLKASYTRPPFDQVSYERSLDDLVDRYASLKIKEGKEGEDPVLEEGDACVVLMDGFFVDSSAPGGKGEPLPEGKASGDQVDIIMKKGRYMEGLVEGLIGAKKDEVRDVKVQFPNILKDKELAGKEAIFEVTVLTVDSRVLPPLDDEFAAKVRPGVEGFTIEVLKNEIKKAVDEEGKDAETILKNRDAALEKSLLENVDMNVPESLVTTRCREKFALMLTEMRDNGSDDKIIKELVTPENFNKYRELTKDDVVKELKASIVVDEIGRLESIVVAPQEVTQLLERVKKEQEDNGNKEFDEAGVKSQIEATLMRRYVFDFLAKEAKELVVEEVKVEEGSKGKEFDQKMMDDLLNESVKREGGN